MKKTITIGLLLILFAFTNQAQKIYSIENLDKASQEDLDLYLEKAQKLKETGKTMTFVGSVTTVLGLLPMVAGGTEGSFYSGLFLSVVGLGVTVVGIPILITGSSRVKRINEIKHTGDGIRIDLAPSGIYNYATQNYQPGITLRVRF